MPDTSRWRPREATMPADPKPAVKVMALRVHESVWYPSQNVQAKRLLADHEVVSVTVTYDDGSQIVFQREVPDA
jgi:hypothetical protein